KTYAPSPRPSWPPRRNDLSGAATGLTSPSGADRPTTAISSTTSRAGDWTTRCAGGAWSGIRRAYTVKADTTRGPAMHIAANLVVALVALAHLYFLALEMFFWTRPLGLRTFGMTQDFANSTAVLASNQGLYNGFLAAGLIWSLFA